MNKKSEYEEAKMEVLLFEMTDIVTTSGWTDSSGEEDSPDSGWTPRRSSGDW